MSAVDDLSPIAKHALWVSCMDSNVPVQIADPATVERVSALLRPVVSADTKGRTSSARPPVPPSITVPRSPCQEAPNGSYPYEEPL